MTLLTRPGRLLATALFAALVIVAAIGQPGRATADTAEEIEAGVDSALKELYAAEPATQDLAKQAKAILVFPKIVKGGVLIGGQYGEGALRVGGKTQGYFSIAAASFGLQFGGQTFSQAMFFLTDEAIQYVKDNNGWEAGVGPTIVGGDEGWTRAMGTNDLQGDIAVVFFGQEGMMAGGGIQGSKITRIDR